jgi:hypothetical protein
MTMAKNAIAPEIALEVSDASGQRVVNVSNVPTANTVGELIAELVGKMGLPKNDSTGAALTYQALSQREQRHLNASERIGDALENLDQIKLTPNIDAGMR